MEIQTNPIKRAFERINMSDAMKRRVISGCREALAERENEAKFPFKKALAVAVCLFLIAASVFTTVAVVRYLNSNLTNEAHTPLNWERIESDPVSPAEESPYLITVEAVYGDGQRGYIDIALERKDGGIIIETEADRFVSLCFAADPYLMFADGYRKDVWRFSIVNDSTENKYRLEAVFAIIEDDRAHFGEEADLYIGEIKVMKSLSEYRDDRAHLYTGAEEEVLCEINDPLKIKFNMNASKVEFTIDDGFELLDGGIVLHRGEINATELNLYGECSLQGKLYDLKPIMENAYVIYDGKTVPLGTKSTGGTDPATGEFVIGWLMQTVADPESIEAVVIDGITIPVK